MRCCFRQWPTGSIAARYANGKLNLIAVFARRDRRLASIRLTSHLDAKYPPPAVAAVKVPTKAAALLAEEASEPGTSPPAHLNTPPTLKAV